uniref:TLDc domain-containing protein n=1 Tax=Scleropages formosus TaxID=113540 RepID=A0A8C9QPI5_SCLFO
MASLCSGLELQQERRLLGMFPQPVVKFILLYKASRHGSGSEALRLKTEQLKKFVILVYLKSGSVMGGFISQEFPSFTWSTKKEDADAFVFSLSPKDGGRFPVRDPSQALQYDKDTKTFSFGGSFKVTDSGNGWSVSLGSESDLVTHKDTVHLNHSIVRHMVRLKWGRGQNFKLFVMTFAHKIQYLSMQACMSLVFRNREDLRETLVSYKPSNEELTQARVLLLGPMGAGKSSFINSIRSVLYRHVVNLPIVGSGSLKSYPIRARKGGPVTALTLCDTMALGNSEWNGLTVHDALAVIKGHASDGHKFQPEAPIQPSTAGYRLDPSLKDKIHCVVFTLDARELTSYTIVFPLTGTPQFVLLTHMDLVCTSGMRDIYTSRVVQAKMQEAAELAGMPLSFVLPVKNYASELAVDCDIDILLLGAVAQILQAIEDSLED